MSVNTQYKKDNENRQVDQEQMEDLKQEEREPEFDEIGTALNAI